MKLCDVALGDTIYYVDSYWKAPDRTVARTKIIDGITWKEVLPPYELYRWTKVVLVRITETVVTDTYAPGVDKEDIDVAGLICDPNSILYTFKVLESSTGTIESKYRVIYVDAENLYILDDIVFATEADAAVYVDERNVAV